MKEKIILASISIIVLIGAIFTVTIIKNETKEQKQEKIKISQQPVTDECTREYEMAKNEEAVEQVSSRQEKISSNSSLILKKYYKECGHTINEYLEMLPELVNMTQEEINEELEGWELIGFSSREVILLKEFEGSCDEHFILREEDGIVVIYKILVDGTKQIYEKTEISTEFLPETDLIKMQSEDGIQVFSKEELNKILEDFE